MIDEKYLNSFVAKEKTELVKKIEDVEKDYEKVLQLENYEKTINEIVDQYSKLINFSKLLLESILDENKSLLEAILIRKVINDKLFIKWNKNDKIFEIDFEKSSTLLEEKEYLEAIKKFLEIMRTKLAKRVIAYQISIDDIKLKDWGDF